MGIYKKGKYWWFKKIFKGRKYEQSLRTAKKALAEKLYSKIITDIIEGEYFDRPKDIFMSEVIEKYMVEFSPQLSATTHERNKQLVYCP